MKHIAYFILLFFCSSAVKSQTAKTYTKFFPLKHDVISPEYVGYKNFFPLVSLDLSNKGIKDVIPVIYVFFDADKVEDKYFEQGQFTSNYSFKIKDDKCQPSFNKMALRVGEDAKEDFKDCQKKYEENKVPFLIDFPSKPEWWQADETPKNSKGKRMKFICQIDLDDILEIDGRMYVFYDESDQVIRNVIQSN